MAQLQAPALRQGERIEEGVEQRNVAEAKAKPLQPRLAHRSGGKAHDLGIGLIAAGNAIAFDAGLTEFSIPPRTMRLKAECRAVIAIAGRDVGFAGGARDKASTPAR